VAVRQQQIGLINGEEGELGEVDRLGLQEGQQTRGSGDDDVWFVAKEDSGAWSACLGAQIGIVDRPLYTCAAGSGVDDLYEPFAVRRQRFQKPVDLQRELSCRNQNDHSGSLVFCQSGRYGLICVSTTPVTHKSSSPHYTKDSPTWHPRSSAPPGRSTPRSCRCLSSPGLAHPCLREEAGSPWPVPAWGAQTRGRRGRARLGGRGSRRGRMRR
jgi:hypothetical protein